MVKVELVSGTSFKPLKEWECGQGDYFIDTQGSVVLIVENDQVVFLRSGVILPVASSNGLYRKPIPFKDEVKLSWY